MATVQSVIDSCRYDIMDYETGLMFDSDELLNYINRMIGVLDSELAVLGSDLVEGEETDIDAVADQNYIDISGMNSGLWDSIRKVWIGSDIIEKITLNNLRYKRMYRTGNGKPYYWALYNQQILWEQDSDQAYTTITIYYNKRTAELGLTDSMPYNDRFNESIREMLTLYAAARKEGAVSNVNAAMQGLFKKRAMEEVIRRRFIPMSYNIDF